ncbi:thioredoxin domain-containing protein [Halothermothrix orenii]|uniref:Putative glutamate--cysteine ligase/putative amino acid ligase n=1 Tax=Halothermothrix orenii (strain H 168 / OCM 544 / DSM 9562) TaxID=373903 RepID=B8CX66_HALOH|nr:thioredoxin domain-containing protein [Halothermothrix orenii]ACL69885.1 putative glutamate--cysteine ligase/putative amino acid ligase [Halothermothrix orenii H 168]
MIEYTKSKYTNRLINEKSPYLLQHAHNPVDWYPWGNDAFMKAKSEDKPIFLSIGYSTCHWCHVMERESFKDEEVARLLNENFISIKVDREERPDIDAVYMNVCQALTGSGGWPLTILLTPDKKPFFGGTYIPKNSRGGRMGLIDLLSRVTELWSKNNEKIIKNADKITSSIQRSMTDDSYKGHKETSLGKNTLEKAFDDLKVVFDVEYGGFGTAPKFPIPHQLIFLLHYWYRTGNDMALYMVEKTLTAMRCGGIFDHIGYGFHRYSTDRKWILPHFEKMLYDQALLTYSYSEAYLATENKKFLTTIKEIIDYVRRELKSDRGGFYSAQDAESEGVEGKYYTWSVKEIENILGKQADRFIETYSLKSDGNFIDEATGKKTGKNVLYLRNYKEEVEELKKEREKLFKVRQRRRPPFKDDKILTDWNGLMIAGLARAGQATGEIEYITMAREAADFIINNLYSSDNRLYHRFRKGEVSIKGNLNDYAFFIWGLLELYQDTFEVKYLKKALKLIDQQLNYFWDNKNGGFYFTPDDEEEILVRQKEIYDGATPSGNSVSIWNLYRIGHLTGNSDYEEIAENILRVFSDKIKNDPASYSMALIGLNSLLGPGYDVVVVGDKNKAKTHKILYSLKNEYIPNVNTLFKPAHNGKILTELGPFIENYHMINNLPTIYVCKDYSCRRPTNNVDEAISMLKK